MRERRGELSWERRGSSRGSRLHGESCTVLNVQYGFTNKVRRVRLFKVFYMCNVSRDVCPIKGVPRGISHTSLTIYIVNLGVVNSGRLAHVYYITEIIPRSLWK